VRCIAANLLFVLAGLTGCIGDQPPASGGGTPDARLPTSDARPPAGDAGPIADAAPFRCRDRLTAGFDTGHHNPGQDCQSNCHNHGFFMSGTLYGSAGGGAAMSGVSITFVDADGQTGDMLSGTNGNFWWSLPVTFPVTITASACPDIKMMSTTVTAADAGCNRSGCHAGGGATGRIHLP